MKQSFLISLAILFVLLIQPASAEPSKELSYNAQSILHKIGGDDTHAFFGFQPGIKFVNSPAIDAFITREGKIHITRGFHELIGNNQAELAFLLAHEAAHRMLNHHRSARFQGSSSDRKGHIRRELAADDLALQLLSEAGYDTSAGHSLLSKVMAFGDGYGLSMSAMYPSLEVRISKLPVDSDEK